MHCRCLKEGLPQLKGWLHTSKPSQTVPILITLDAVLPAGRGSSVRAPGAVRWVVSTTSSASPAHSVPPCCSGNHSTGGRTTSLSARPTTPTPWRSAASAPAPSWTGFSEQQGNRTTPPASLASSARRAWTESPSRWTRRTRSTASRISIGGLLRDAPSANSL